MYIRRLIQLFKLCQLIPVFILTIRIQRIHVVRVIPVLVHAIKLCEIIK